MPEIRIVRAIKPKEGQYISEGTYEYIGKHPYENEPGFFAGMKVVWRGRFFSSQNSILVFPDFCSGISHLTDDKAKFETRWSSFLSPSPGRRASAIQGGALGGLLAGAVGAAFAKTKNIKGFAAYYHNERQSPGGFLAVAAPEIVDEIFSVMPPDKMIELPT